MGPALAHRKPPRSDRDGPALPGVTMAEATFWFSSPFREWLGQRTLTVRWTDRITLREVLQRLGSEHAAFRRNVTDDGLAQDAFDHLAAVIVDGDFLALDSVIPDGAEVHVFTPLAGGACPPTKRLACCLPAPPF